MGMLFTPGKIGDVEVKNRFVHAATYSCMAEEDGKVSDALLKRYGRLARGDVGLIIPGVMNVHPYGRGPYRAIGIYEDRMVEGLRRLTETVHAEGARIFFQLHHAGRQTKKEIIGRTPMAPSTNIWDPLYLVKPREMTNDEIWESIEAFGEAARRAAEAGADGVHIAASGGYLINEFLSPFHNRRKDEWGGSDGKRFRFLSEVMKKVKAALPAGMALTVKLTANDYTPWKGITTPLAARYAAWLAEMGIDGLEIASGTVVFSNLRIWRGEVPVKELVSGVPAWQKPFAWLMLKSWAGKFDLEEGYNLEDAKVIKPAAGKASFILVGGLRRLSHMEEIVENGWADFVALSRPLIREPSLVKKFREGKSEAASCVSCNKCFARVANRLPLRCEKVQK